SYEWESSEDTFSRSSGIPQSRHGVRNPPPNLFFDVRLDRGITKINFQAKADMEREQLVKKPSGWLDLDIWLQEEEVRWRDREFKRGNISAPNLTLSLDQEKSFRHEAKWRRSSYLEALPKPVLAGVD